MVAGPLFSIYNTHKLFSFVVTAQPSSKSPLSPVQISLPKKTWFHHGLLGRATTSLLLLELRPESVLLHREQLRTNRSQLAQLLAFGNAQPHECICPGS